MTTARKFGIALALIVAVAAAPFVATLGAGGIAAVLGCQLDEGNVHPCVVLGVDLGYALYATALSGLLMLITLPAAGIALLIWLIVAGIVLFARRRRPEN